MPGSDLVHSQKSTSPSTSSATPLSDSSNLAHSQIARVGTGFVRSSSPAKRSLSERDDDGEDSDTYGNKMDGREVNGVQRSPSKKNNSAAGSPLPDRSKASLSSGGNQEALIDTVMDEDGHRSNITDSTSSESNAVPRSSPPSSMEGTGDESSGAKATPSFDEQYQRIVPYLTEAQMTEGQWGFLVPTVWLLRVVSRTTDGMKETHPKEAREGAVGPVDTRILVPSSASSDLSGLKDSNGHDFLPVKTGLRMGDDFQVFPQPAWNLLLSWYGLAEGAPTITRFAHNTNTDSDSQANFQYEVYPPLFTIQKVSTQKERSLESIRYQNKPAARLVASRSDSYQGFLVRAKQALEIPMKNKVQVWKIMETLQTVPGRAGIPTPSSSRDPSPAPQLALAGDLNKLTIDVETLTAMPEGSRRELLSFKDETMNEKYNGHLTLGQVGFPEVQNLVLEEKSHESDQFASQSQAKMGASDASTVTNKAQTSSDQVDRPSANTRGIRSSSPFVLSAAGRMNKKGKIRGSTGLTNLGNTCYMNSALQCIRSVEELSIYFLKSRHETEINKDNPLGHNGQIAAAYASLVNSVFTTENSFSPRVFKAALGKCQPLFSGYGQQDSQEFLSFLIDGLHEDLNKVQKKPYIENPDSNDETVHDPEAIKELGETYCSNHRKRNDSVAMDLFSGFYKNTMVCPICAKVSVTFDPYAQVTLQLPVEDTFTHKITMVPLRDVPKLVDVDIGKNTTIRGLKDYVAKRFPGVKAQNIVFAENYNDKFYKVFEDAETLAELSIQSNDILYAFELDDSPTNWPPIDKKKPKAKTSFLTISPLSSQDSIPEMSSSAADRMAVPVYQRVSKDDNSSTFCLFPFFIMVTREEAKDYESIFRKVLLKVSTMTTKDIFAETELASGQQSDTDIIVGDEDGSKVQAKSIEGDDDLVDVSMTDGGNDHLQDGKPTSKRHSSVLDQSNFIDGELRNLFEIGVYHATQEVVPTGFSIVSNNSKWPLLRERSVRQSRQRPWMKRKEGPQRQDRWAKESLSSSESEDELTSSDHGLHNGRPAISEPDNAESETDERSTFDQSRSPTRKSAFKRSSSKLRANFKQFGGKFKRSQSRNNEKEDYVLRLGEGLILDWNTALYDSLFCGDTAEDFKGQRSDLNIATIPDPELNEQRNRRNIRKKQGVTLDECFEETGKSEILSEENTWYCSRCKEMRRASKTLELWTVPDILIVHLKRFSSQSRLRDKVDILVDFPVEGLDLTGKVGLPEDKSLTYDLFAVDNHYGGLGGGHYTAVARNFVDGEWYDYNDAFVAKTTGAHAVSKSAYLLFYRRRQEGKLGPPYLQELVNSAYSDSRSPSPAGKDQQDDPPLYNGSSTSSQNPGGNTLRNHGSSGGMLGGAGGATQDTNDDEGIDVSADSPLPGLEDAQSQKTVFESTWTFDNLISGTQAPHGSIDGIDGSASSSTAGNAASEAPEFQDLEDRMEEDFPVEERIPFKVGGQMSHLPPNGDEDEAFVEHIGVGDNADVDDEKVAEVRLSDDDGL